MIGREYKWYVVYTRSHHEKRVHNDVRKLGIETYLPLIKSFRIWSDRKKFIDMPLFPNYLFVRISNREYHKITDHPSLIGFVKSGNELSVIRDDLFDAMVRIVDERMDFTLSSNYVLPGVSVQVISGPLSGLKGVITRIEGKSLLTVEIRPVNQTFLVRIKEDHVVPLKESVRNSA